MPTPQLRLDLAIPNGGCCWPAKEEVGCGREGQRVCTWCAYASSGSAVTGADGMLLIGIPGPDGRSQLTRRRRARRTGGLPEPEGKGARTAHPERDGMTLRGRCRTAPEGQAQRAPAVKCVEE